MKVISNNHIAKDTFELVLDAPNLQVFPGQFMHLKTGENNLILRRPISIASYDSQKLKLVYKVVGAGTKAMTSFTKDDIVDALGPLGQGFKTDNVENVLIVGGGMGVAPLYQLAKELFSKGVKITFVLGFMDASSAYYVQKFMRLGKVHVTTDDGSMGVQGHVGVVVDTLGFFDAIYACGPLALLNYLKRKYEAHPQLYISLEERMACGIGACYACDTKDKKHRVCTDGPVFNAKEVEI